MCSQSSLFSSRGSLSWADLVRRRSFTARLVRALMVVSSCARKALAVWSLPSVACTSTATPLARLSWVVALLTAIPITPIQATRITASFQLFNVPPAENSAPLGGKAMLSTILEQMNTRDVYATLLQYTSANRLALWPLLSWREPWNIG